MTDEIRVSTWTELHEVLYNGSWSEPLGRFRSNVAFRGRGGAGEDLHTSLMRLGGDAGALESHLLRAFRKYAPRRDVPVDSVWNPTPASSPSGSGTDETPRARERA